LLIHFLDISCWCLLNRMLNRMILLQYTCKSKGWLPSVVEQVHHAAEQVTCSLNCELVAKIQCPMTGNTCWENMQWWVPELVYHAPYLALHSLWTGVHCLWTGVAWFVSRCALSVNWCCMVCELVLHQVHRRVLVFTESCTISFTVY
jgi:hypothetical protein